MFSYRKNKKIVKRELIEMAAALLPAIRNVSDHITDISEFAVHLTNETKGIKGERLVEMILDEISAALQTNNHRMIELLTYIANLQPSDIQKIITHSIVETTEKKE